MEAFARLSGSHFVDDDQSRLDTSTLFVDQAICCAGYLPIVSPSAALLAPARADNQVLNAQAQANHQVLARSPDAQKRAAGQPASQATALTHIVKHEASNIARRLHRRRTWSAGTSTPCSYYASALKHYTAANVALELANRLGTAFVKRTYSAKPFRQQYKSQVVSLGGTGATCTAYRQFRKRFNKQFSCHLYLPSLYLRLKLAKPTHSCTPAYHQRATPNE